MFIKKCLLITVGSVCRIKQFTTGLTNSFFESHRWYLTRSPCWDCDKSNCAAGGRDDSSWQRNNNRQCIKCTRCSHGLAYSIMHDRSKFRKVCAWWVPRELKDWQETNRTSLSLQHLLRHADEGKDMLNWTVTGDKSLVHHYQLQPKCASMNGNNPVHLLVQPKSLRLWVRHQLGGYAYCVLGVSGSTVSPFPEVWWKCEFCIAL
jgi:hypothetical protein